MRCVGQKRIEGRGAPGTDLQRGEAAADCKAREHTRAPTLQPEPRKQPREQRRGRAQARHIGELAGEPAGREAGALEQVIVDDQQQQRRHPDPQRSKPAMWCAAHPSLTRCQRRAYSRPAIHFVYIS